MRITPEKWRPTLSMVVLSTLIFILCLPITGIWIFRFYDSQLVRETEQELIVQAAFIEALVIDKFEQSPLPLSYLGKKITKQNLKNKGQEGEFLQAKLDLALSAVLPPRSDPKIVSSLPDLTLLKIGGELGPILNKAQKITLAGFRVLDPNGIIIAGRSNIGKSLAHVPEVKAALEGRYESVIRQRISKHPSPPIYTISRGTGIRVFITMPIVYQNHVAGVIYLSRTPSHFLRELYGQKWKIALAALFMLFITFIIAYVFIRTIKGPIEALHERTKRIAHGDRTALEPLSHHGTKELADLSDGLLSMSKKLHDRSDYINTFATHVSHELKSPLTSIQGAAELLHDANDQMSEAERSRFLVNITQDTQRLNKLLDRLRDLAEVDNSDDEGSCIFAKQIEPLQKKFPDLITTFNIPDDCQIKLTPENTEIILSNLIINAQQHGAEKVHIEVKNLEKNVLINVLDDGDGVSELNRDKIFQLFFTTKREAGGTGMGLGIIQSILNSHGGTIKLKPVNSGTCFELTIPTV